VVPFGASTGGGAFLCRVVLAGGAGRLVLAGCRRRQQDLAPETGGDPWLGGRLGGEPGLGTALWACLDWGWDGASREPEWVPENWFLPGWKSRDSKLGTSALGPILLPTAWALLAGWGPGLAVGGLASSRPGFVGPLKLPVWHGFGRKLPYGQSFRDHAACRPPGRGGSNRLLLLLGAVVVQPSQDAVVSWGGSRRM